MSRTAQPNMMSVVSKLQHSIKHFAFLLAVGSIRFSNLSFVLQMSWHAPDSRKFTDMPCLWIFVRWSTLSLACIGSTKNLNAPRIPLTRPSYHSHQCNGLTWSSELYQDDYCHFGLHYDRNQQNRQSLEVVKMYHLCYTKANDFWFSLLSGTEREATWGQRCRPGQEMCWFVFSKNCMYRPTAAIDIYLIDFTGICSHSPRPNWFWHQPHKWR